MESLTVRTVVSDGVFIPCGIMGSRLKKGTEQHYGAYQIQMWVDAQLMYFRYGECV